MIEAIVLSGEEVRPEQLFPALMNPAVAHCCSVQEQVFQSELKKKRSECSAMIKAGDAYCRAMPPLSGYLNICDFIACVSYGMLTNTILNDSATKLLYAAQVALSTVPKPPKPSKN
ncbi:MAG: hypothetical protein ABR923_01505 [Terracidiphilus sp.]|jgi:hypothetical protein